MFLVASIVMFVDVVECSMVASCPVHFPTSWGSALDRGWAAAALALSTPSAAESAA